MIQDVIKIIVSVLLAFLVGLEREKQHKSAGLRDVMLVTLGATLFAIVGQKLFGESSIDIARLFYAPIVGIGFLGGGVIMKKDKDIEGITTASTLWAMVGIGLLCGIEEYILATLATVVICLILLLKYFQFKFKVGLKKTRKRYGKRQG